MFGKGKSYNDYGKGFYGTEHLAFAKKWACTENKDGYAEQFAAGGPKVVSGMSSTELVMDVLTKSGTDMDFLQVQIDYDYSPQYWCGWILAYYQWYTGQSFKEIQKYITM